MAELEIESVSRRRISRVWIVPIIAALIGALVVWQSYSQRGPLVEIHFDKSHGIAAGKTEIRHKDVVVGMVEEVTLSENLESVVVKARMEKFIAPYLGNGASFWVVSANVSGTNLSGLGTILSGAYIEVDWEKIEQKRQRVFDGLDTPPMTPPGAMGTHFPLRAKTAASVRIGSPVYFRGLKVGEIESRRLSEDYDHVEYVAFVHAPYDDLLNEATRFWNVSGVSVEAAAEGFKVNIASLESLVAGGVAFGDIGRSLGNGGLASDKEFRIFPSRAAALESKFDMDDDRNILFMATFDESLGGLQPGAPVEWQGIRVGSVNDIVLDLSKPPTERGFIYVVIEMQPARIGLEDMPAEQRRENLAAWVKSGMRLQLASGNVLTGRKLIRLVDNAGETEVDIDYNALPYPQLPTTASDFGAVAQNVERLVANMANLPLDQLVGSMIGVLEDAGALLASDATQALPADLGDTVQKLNEAIDNISVASRDLPALIANLNQVVTASESTLTGLSPDSELYVDLSSAVRELRDAMRSIAALAARLEENPNAIILGR